MEYSWMLPIQPKWVEQIRNGIKEYEFRPYALEVGVKVYIYESLGKKTARVNAKLYDKVIGGWNVYEGAGAVVGEFVVEECISNLSCHALGRRATELGYNNAYGLCSDKTNECVMDYDKALKLGYNNQKYAIKISQLKFYDKPIPKEEFVSYSKFIKHYADYNSSKQLMVLRAPQRAIKVVK